MVPEARCVGGVSGFRLRRSWDESLNHKVFWGEVGGEGGLLLRGGVRCQSRTLREVGAEQQCEKT